MDTTIASINELLTKKIQDNYCICVLPASLGDTLLFFENKKIIEKFNNVKLFPIIKRAQKTIPLMCNETDFATINVVEDILEFPIVKELYPHASSVINIGNTDSHIKKSRFFIAHPDRMPNRKASMKLPNNDNWFIEFTKFMYDIPYKEKLEFNSNLNRYRNKIALNKTILLAPESSCMVYSKISFPPIDIYIEIAKRYIDSGYNVIYNAQRQIPELDKYALWFNGPLDRALEIASSCDKVYSIRSGLCDLLKSINKDLTVIYPNQWYYDYFSLQAMYQLNEIKEYIYKDNLLDFKKLILQDMVID